MILFLGRVAGLIGRSLRGGARELADGIRISGALETLGGLLFISGMSGLLTGVTVGTAKIVMPALERRLGPELQAALEPARRGAAEDRRAEAAARSPIASSSHPAETAGTPRAIPDAALIAASAAAATQATTSTVSVTEPEVRPAIGEVAAHREEEPPGPEPAPEAATVLPSAEVPPVSLEESESRLRELTRRLGAMGGGRREREPDFSGLAGPRGDLP